MKKFIMQIIIGLILIVVGMFNTKGNISILHSYHRKRVKEIDRIPFGKKVGIGSIIIGISIILLILNYTSIGNIVITIGLIIGLVIIIYALFKYNRGIF